jgi:hypothetical protein
MDGFRVVAASGHLYFPLAADSTYLPVAGGSFALPTGDEISSPA